MPYFTRRKVFHALLAVERCFNPMSLVFVPLCSFMGSKKANRVAWAYECTLFKPIRWSFAKIYGLLGYDKAFREI